jgi:hypothetical protein
MAGSRGIARQHAMLHEEMSSERPLFKQSN